MSYLLFGETGKRAERVEWGIRYTHDCAFGRRGDVDPVLSEQVARRHGGAFYEGGLKKFRPVRRVVVTYTSAWEDA